MKLCAYSKTPKLHQSTAAPYFFPNSNSGAIYSAVPILQYSETPDINKPTNSNIGSTLSHPYRKK